MSEMTMPRTQGPNGGHAARELVDGHLGGYVGGDFRRVSPGLMEAHRPADKALFVDLYRMCCSGALREAVQVTKRFADAPYSRGLREGVAYTDLDTALDGSVRTMVLDSWNEVEWGWAEVLEIVDGITDYETHKLATLSEIVVDDQTSNATASGTLPKVPARHGYDEAALTEKYETFAIEDYGCVFSIDDRALRADDKNVLPGIPRLLGRSARRTVSASVAYLFEQQSGTGPTMTETSAVAFSSGNGNYTNVDITLAYVQAAYSAMAAQTAYGSGRLMNLRPSWLVVPAALELTAAAIIGPNATKLIDGTATAAQSDFNGVAGRLRLSVWDSLTDTDAWMLFCDWRDFRTAVIAFLDGIQEPIIEVQGGLGPDLSSPIGKKYRVRAPHGVGLVDYRGIYRSIGAG